MINSTYEQYHTAIAMLSSAALNMTVTQTEPKQQEPDFPDVVAKSIVTLQKHGFTVTHPDWHVQ